MGFTRDFARDGIWGGILGTPKCVLGDWGLLEYTYELTKSAVLTTLTYELGF